MNKSLIYCPRRVGESRGLSQHRERHILTKVRHHLRTTPYPDNFFNFTIGLIFQSIHHLNYKFETIIQLAGLGNRPKKGRKQKFQEKVTVKWSETNQTLIDLTINSIIDPQTHSWKYNRAKFITKSRIYQYNWLPANTGRYFSQLIFKQPNLMMQLETKSNKSLNLIIDPTNIVYFRFISCVIV